MNGPFDETLLTAFVLGEVTDEQAREIAARLEHDHEARAFIEAQRELATSLEAALGAEVGPGLDAGRREEVLSGGSAGTNWPLYGLRAAAVIFLCVGLGVVWADALPDRQRPATKSGAAREVARNHDVVADRVAKKWPVSKSAHDVVEEELEEVEEAVVTFDTKAVMTAQDQQLLQEKMMKQQEGARVGYISANPVETKPLNTFVGANVMRPQLDSAPSAGLQAAGGGAPPVMRATPGATPPSRGFTRYAGGNMPMPKKAAPAGGGRRKGKKAMGVGGGAGGAFGGRVGSPGGNYTGPPARERQRVRPTREHRAPNGVVFGLHDKISPSQGTEEYNAIVENAYRSPEDEPLSTLSVDVDTASYANVRRFLNANGLPPVDAVRIEEMINYFNYSDPAPEGDDPFAVTTEVAACPWNLDHRLMRIGIKAKEVDMAGRAASNLVFLLDVSGSMNRPDKLPLLKQAMKMLVDNLDERDTVSIVVYAGSSGLVLPPTNGASKGAILDSIDRLRAGGSTNGEAGIQQAYSTALSELIKGGNNRVIWCTDGDLNVGVSDQGGLVKMIQEKRESGVFLSVLGFGTGNLKDSKLERIADEGNGTYSYIDSVREARKVLVEEMGGTLFTVAKDVKIQVEFNPAVVGSYRLIGYENRLLAAQDFNNDKKDAGEIGAGHSIVALYEIRPRELGSGGVPSVDPLKYQRRFEVVGGGAGEVGTVKLRFKEPDGDTSALRQFVVVDTSRGYAEASIDFKLAASVAAFGMILRRSPHKGTSSLPMVHELVGETLSQDRGGYRAELMDLIDRAKALVPKQ